MAGYNDNLPGGCFVNEIQNNLHGIQLPTELLEPYGFNQKQTATLLISKGQILITTDPKLSSIMDTINELQCRQDEIGQDFEPAIYALLKMLKPSI